jgi:hypothetical protein
MSKELVNFDEIIRYLVDYEFKRNNLNNLNNFEFVSINPTKEAVADANSVKDREYQHICYAEKKVEEYLDKVELLRKSIKSSKANISRCDVLIMYYDIINN